MSFNEMWGANNNEICGLSATTFRPEKFEVIGMWN